MARSCLRALRQSLRSRQQLTTILSLAWQQRARMNQDGNQYQRKDGMLARPVVRRPRPADAPAPPPDPTPPRCKTESSVQNHPSMRRTTHHSTLKILSNFPPLETFPPHLCHLPTGVPGVHVEDAPGEAAELVRAVQDLHGVSSADALALQLLQPLGPDEVATAVGVTPARPGNVFGRCLRCCCWWWW